MDSTGLASRPLWHGDAAHDFVPPLLLVLAAWLAAALGLDARIADAFYDTTLQGFPARSVVALDLIGHRLAKSAVVAVWLMLFAAALAARWVPALARHRPLLWTAVVAMAAGPLIVVALKGMTTHPCPWDLKRYGGLSEAARDWFVSRAQAGRCFPSGHAAGGGSLVALYFGARAADRPRLARQALWVALAAATVFGAVRMAQGAHFLSHNLWAFAVDWFAAALVFRLAAGLRAGAQDRSDTQPKVQPPGWQRLAAATGYAAAGLRVTWKREAAFRQEAVVAVLLAPVALLAPVSPIERAGLLGVLAMVLVVELLNSAIEAVVDLVSPQFHPMARIAKDAGAAAVMLALACAALTWAIVLWPGVRAGLALSGVGG